MSNINGGIMPGLWVYPLIWVYFRKIQQLGMAWYGFANVLRRNSAFLYGDIWREIMDFRALQLYWVFVCFVLFFCFGLCLFWSEVCCSRNDCLFMTSGGQGGKGNNSAHLERMTSSKWFLLLAKLRIYSPESLPALSGRKNTMRCGSL